MFGDVTEEEHATSVSEGTSNTKGAETMRIHGGISDIIWISNIEDRDRTRPFDMMILYNSCTEREEWKVLN